MTKTDNPMADANVLLARGEEMIRHWDANWLSREIPRDELIGYYRATVESIGSLLRDVKPIREALVSSAAEVANQLADLRKRLIVVRVRAENGIRHMTEPFVPKDPERYERAMREAAVRKAIPIEDILRSYRERGE